jgi:hypothetical protein
MAGWILRWLSAVRTRLRQRLDPLLEFIALHHQLAVCVPKTSSLLAPNRIIYHRSEMIALMCFCLRLFTSPLRSKIRLEAENAILRHQLIVLERQIRGRVRFTNGDRLFFIRLYRLFPSMLDAFRIIRPETLVRWHRAGFRRYWRWKSRSAGGRPPIDADLRALIRQMSVDNPLWGAPRIHGELLTLGFQVAQSSVAKYMIRRPASPRRDGLPSFATTRRKPPPWTCSWFRASLSNCSTSSSSSG